jgi:CRISPR-associated Cas5-like protein
VSVPAVTAIAPVDAVRAEFYAPVASFRDPMFPGVTRCLPVPPPSTLRGMLAAATGNPAEPVTLGFAARAQGGGTDLETYHPVSTDGGNPAVAGRVRAVKGGMTIRNRPFLAMLEVTVWIPEPDADRIAAALRRPVWGLRLGRSQDAVYLRSLTRVRLEPTENTVVGHALAPAGGHADPAALTVHLPETVTPDRLSGQSGDYLWCADGGGRQAVRGALSDGDQAVWLHAAG